LTPCAILVATLPGNGNGGFIDISGSGLRIVLVVICGLLAVVGLVTACVKHADHGLLFGSATVFTALTAVAVLVSVFTRRNVEDQAGRTFVLLAALSVILLVLAAHDWARRQLLVAAVIVAAALSLFIVRVGFDSLKVPPQWERAQIADRADAAESALALQNKQGASVSSAALDHAICVIYPPSGKCESAEPAAITTNREWVTAQHELDVDLATYRAEITGAKADQTALQAVLARQPDIDEDISMLAAIENGPQAMWRSAFHAVGPALVPGPLGWVVLGGLLFGLLSWLLKINANQLSGPVSVAPASSGDKDKLTAALRVAVLQNVAEPGAAPGSVSINPVTTLLDIAGGPLSAVSKIVQAVQATVGQRYGYQVTIDVTSGDLAGPGLVTAEAGAGSPHPGECTTVLVRVMSLANGITYASHLCSSPDDIEAVRTAGLWAAGYILNRSSRIPRWAAWQAETAHALVTVKDKADHTIPALKAALADAPNSGLLLVLLGHRYELADQVLDAIECYARAVTAYDRYPVARYRLAVALDSMRHDRDWRSPSRREREDGMRRAVKSAVDAVEVEVKDNTITNLKEEPDQQEFKDLARKLLRSLETDTRLRYRLVDALRRSEREFIWPALLPSSQHPAARFPALVKSARQALDYEKADSKEVEKLDQDANKADSWWQISYNAACSHAARVAAMDHEPADGADERPQATKNKDKIKKEERQRTEAEKALGFLEQTLVRMGAEQLSADWVRHDPDLAALHGLPRFKRFLAQLRPGELNNAGSDSRSAH
jgi:hypothetical protein